MKRNLTKMILTMTLTILIAGTTTTVAWAHHSHSSDNAAQNTSGYQSGHCHEDEYCDVNQVYQNDGYCERGRHHANFYCGSRSEYYARRSNRLNCRY